jgi:hypothetical protein
MPKTNIVPKETESESGVLLSRKGEGEAKVTVTATDSAKETVKD